ncbi:MAG TPA: hypothetical protein VK539_12025 [Myxococcaceae bacterium]|nr:hypothetical protein [Myxococcaceae bacterium]
MKSILLCGALGLSRSAPSVTTGHGEQMPGFKPRTVSLTDLAWVVVAARDIDANGGMVDEARVNRLRYLEGTASDSTRWIDTRWAIAAYQVARDRLGSLSPESTP